MRIKNTFRIVIALILISFPVVLNATDLSRLATPQIPQEDYQLLYNGKVWRSLYYNIRGNEFLFSADFLNGSVTINGRKFSNLEIRYDIYNDEIISPVSGGTYIQLNKEMVTAFELNYADVLYRFKKLSDDSTGSLTGYVNVLHEGKNSLYLKYRKDIKELAVEKKYDEFNQRQILYLEHEGEYYKLNGKGDLIKIFRNESTPVNEFIKKEKIKIRKSQPATFIPVLKYIDNLP